MLNPSLHSPSLFDLSGGSILFIERWLVTMRIMCSRRERALSRSSGKSVQRAAPAVFNVPQSPTSTWSPTPSPTSPLPSHGYYEPIMDEPLALIKKPRKEPENTEEKAKSTATNQIQVIWISTVCASK